jgi:hypothetical protein
MQSGPKSAYAQSQFNIYTSQGMSVDQALNSVDADIAREFPSVNPDRDNYPAPERGTRPGAKRGAKKLSMGDLTNDELKYYRAMPGAWKNEAEFLQAVQDTRNSK